MTDPFGIDIDLPGSDFGEPQAPEGVRLDMPLSLAAASIPQMSRPYKGVRVITQFFGGRHYGADIGIPTGTPIYAAHAGQVVAARADSTGYGFVIAIKDDSRGIYSVYGHLNGMAGIIVRAGEWVAERQHIGYSDNTGNSTGPHLHVELRVRPYSYPGCCVDPLRYMQVWEDAPAPPPTPPPAPTPTGSRWQVVKRQGAVSIYARANKSSQVVGHLQRGAVFSGEAVAGKPTWVRMAQGYVMIVNGNNILLQQV